MKKVFFSIFCVVMLAATVSLSSCKKSDSSVNDKLAGKWNYVSLTSHTDFYGQAIDSTITYPSGSYIEFKSDGTMSGDDDGNFEGGWLYKDNKLVTINMHDRASDTMSFDIKKLTGSDLELYNYSAAAKTELTIYLKK